MMAVLILGVFLSPIHGSTVSFVADLGTSARNIALGQIDGFDNTASALYENPAALTTSSVSFFLREMIDSDASFYVATVAYELDAGVFAIGTARHSVSGLSYTGINDSQEFFRQRSFSTEQSIISLGYSFASGGVRFGFAGHYFRDDLYESIGEGLDMDMGVTMSIEDIDISLVAKRFLAIDMDYSNSDSRLSLPTQLILGATTSWDQWRFFSQLKHTQNYILPSGAVSYTPNIFGRFLSVMGSWREFLVSGELFQNTTLGIELHLVGVRLNVVYENTDYIPNNHQYHVSTHIVF